MKHLMIDLETMGTKPNAPVIQIGAVFFDPKTGQTGAEFETKIEPANAAKFGIVSQETKEWWDKQDIEVRELVFSGTNTTPLALDMLAKFITDNSSGMVRPWGNGKTFDTVLLEDKYDVIGKLIPWKYWNVLDVRTMGWLFKEKTGKTTKSHFKFEGQKHNALDDAKHQARMVADIYEVLIYGAPKNER